MLKKTASAPKTAPKVAETVAETAESTPKKAAVSGTVKVKFLRSHPEYGYFAGNQAEVKQADFDRIQKDGAFFEKI